MTTISFSDAACAYIKKIITKENGIGLRLSIKKTGCSGFSYSPMVVNQVNPNDLILENQLGTKIYVDRAWLDLLANLQIDYVEDMKGGIKQKKLTFVNPSESSRCGCGESFHVDN